MSTSKVINLYVIELEAPEYTIHDINPYPEKRRLVFRSDGTFKITVFSDLHFGENPWDDWGPQQDINSTLLMRTVLQSETPDYVCVLRLRINSLDIYSPSATVF